MPLPRPTPMILPLYKDAALQMQPTAVAPDKTPPRDMPKVAENALNNQESGRLRKQNVAETKNKANRRRTGQKKNFRN